MSGFYFNLFAAILLLGFPSIVYLYLSYKLPTNMDKHQSEINSNFRIFNSLYPVFLSITLALLVTNFYSLQIDTAKEAGTVISAATFVELLPESNNLKAALIDYTKATIEHDSKTIARGTLSDISGSAFTELWKDVCNYSPSQQHNRVIYQSLVGELEKMINQRVARESRASNALHPLIYGLIVFGYYVLLIKMYLTRIENKKIQFVFELTTISLILLLILSITDLTTPYEGIVNIDSTPFLVALHKILGQ